jgi:acyl-homoserine lactone acylase PvdQ
LKRLALLAFGLAILWPGSAYARDFASTALNIIPSGQYGDVPIPSGANTQAKMYDGLTPLFGSVKNSDLFKYFKSERLGTKGQGVLRVEKPKAGVRIVRDRFDVPHIFGRTRDDATWATGWVLAEDRHLLLDLARGDTRIAAIDAPGIDAFGLVLALRTFVPSAQTEAIVARQTKALRAAGRKGRQVLHNIDVYVAGINAWYKAQGRPASPPWNRNDVYATNAVAGQLFGRGGGNEVNSSMLLSALQGRLGAKRGTLLWNDLRERNDPEARVTVDGNFPYDPAPEHLGPGNAVIDNGSFQRTPEPSASAAHAPPHASNYLIVGAKRSKSTHPLFVGGPQIGYFYPGLTLEVDLHAPGVEARGATAPGFPGDILIGRGQDYAWSLTSAGSDVIDDYVETLCGGSDTKYVYKGNCRDMGFVNAGVLKGAGGQPDQPVTYHTTVHGPVIGYATVHGRRVAVSQKRSSFGKDVLWQLPFEDLTMGHIHDARQFVKSMQQSPFTFNTGYADDRDIAVDSTGFLPVRARGVDGGLPTNGNGRYEWRGFAPPRLHPHEINSRDGTLVNWNNKPGAGFPAADDQFAYGPDYRVQMLDAGLAHHRKLDLAQVVSAMNRAATEDYRDVYVIPLVARVLRKGQAPNTRDSRMLQLLLQWRARGSSRLDRNLDGKIDDPGAAIMDAFGPRLSDAVMDPVLGPQAAQLDKTLLAKDAGSSSDFQGGWNSYIDKDLRTLLGEKVKGRFHFRFCGNGNVARCANSLWGALDAAGNELQAAQGPNPAAWRADANAERIHFAPGLLSTTIRYTNRPSGIQQVISFSGHRRRG